VIPLDEPEALSLALEGLSRARTWEGEGLLVYALFRGRSCSWSSPPRTP